MQRSRGLEGLVTELWSKELLRCSDCALSCAMKLLQTSKQLSRLTCGCQPFSCRCSQNVTDCRKEICSTCLFGEHLAFLIVDLTFQGQWDLFQVPCQPRSSGGFACLGSHPGLANCAGASIEAVIVARCTGCSSKLCLSFDPFQPRSLQQRRLHKHYNFGTATSYHGLKWS